MLVVGSQTPPSAHFESAQPVFEPPVPVAVPVPVPVPPDPPLPLVKPPKVGKPQEATTTVTKARSTAVRRRKERSMARE
jgi:hypothetical protein